MLGQMVNVSACPRCRGEGRIVEEPCETCQRRGPHRAQADPPGHDPAGIDEGHQIRLSDEGEVGPRGGAPGSLYVAVHVAPHPTLKRDGTELYYEGSVVDRPGRARDDDHVPTVEGDEEVEVKAGTQPGTEIRLRGKGVPHLRRPGQRGDLHVIVDVDVPTTAVEEAARGARGIRRGGGRDRRRAAAGCSTGSADKLA